MENLTTAVHRTQLIANIPGNIVAPQIEAAETAALTVFTALLVYVRVAIPYLKRSTIGL
jgi:hypothetical protein